MTKTNIGITVDVEAWMRCKSKNFSISQICNDALIVASNMSVENKLNKAIQVRQDAVDNLNLMINLQKDKVIELEDKRKASLEDFKNPDIVSDNVILPENKHMLDSWVLSTGKTPDQLRAIKQEVINAGQRNRVSFPALKRDELIKDLKAQGLKSDVE